jgi:hypothetical protein
MLAAVGPAAAPDGHHHAVKFYSGDDSLFTTVAEFLSDGLAQDQPAIVIATPTHRTGIEECEQEVDRLCDCRRTGDLVMLDAEETLGQFMIGEEPDDDLFERNIGTLVTQVLSGRGRTGARAKGEIVDVLWRQGNMRRQSNSRFCGANWSSNITSRCCVAMPWDTSTRRPGNSTASASTTRTALPDNVLPFNPKYGG